MASSNLLRFFDGHYILGDSLSDVNNFKGLDPTLPRNNIVPRFPVYNDGRFTNGLGTQGNWADYFATELKIDLSSFYQDGIGGNASGNDGINFALGGDTSGSTNISFLGQVYGANSLGLNNQVTRLASLVNNNTIDSLGDGLIINWVGANDYLAAALTATGDDTIIAGEPDVEDPLGGQIEESNSPPPAIVNYVSQIISNITTFLTTVLNSGAKVVVILNQADLGKTPLAIKSNTTSTLTAFSQVHNQILHQSLNQLRGNYPGAKIIEVDMYGFFNSVLANFANNTQSATATDLYANPPVLDVSLLGGGFPAYLAASQRAANYLWWDSAHPTTTAHKLISDYILKVIEDNIAIKGTNSRDILTGSSSNDLIIGSSGRDVLTGGGGRNVFVYKKLTYAGDIIKDFIVGEDRLNFVGVLKSINFTGDDPLAEGYITLTQIGRNKTMLRLDTDGSLGRHPARPYITLENVDATALNDGSNFIFG